MFLGTRVILGEVKLFEEFGIMRVNNNESSPFGISQSIIEDKNPYCDKPLFYGVDRKPLTFSLRFSKEGSWTVEQRIKFAYLLFKEDYQILKSEDYPEFYYRVICVDDPTKTFFTSFTGYFDINFRCDSPYAWSNETVDQYEVLDNIDNYFYIENKSNVVKYVYPTLEIISSLDNNTISIKNLSDNGRGFTVSELEADEKIIIDNEYGILTTTVPSVYRYNNFDGKWLRLKTGINKISVNGKCIIVFKNIFPMAL